MNTYSKEFDEFVKNLSEQEKRAKYVEAFNQEFDDPSRKQNPLPLDIAYKVAYYSLQNKTDCYKCKAVNDLDNTFCINCKTSL